MKKENPNDINKTEIESKTPENVVPPYNAPDEETLKKQNKKRKQAVIVIVAVSVLVLLLIAVTVVCAMKSTESDNGVQPSETETFASEVLTEAITVTQTETSVEDTTVSQTEAPSVIKKEESSSVAVVAEEKPETTKKKVSAHKKEEKPKKEQPTIEGLPPLTQTGDNILSDSPDNKYIKSVCEKYGVSSDNVVAIYAIPDKGNNFVLEFDGTKDSSGKVIKSPDTLLKVHQIDINGNIKTATGKKKGNIGVSYYEGLMVFYMVTNIVMPQYPDYFTGVK